MWHLPSLTYFASTWGQKRPVKRKVQPLAMCLCSRGQPMLPGTTESARMRYLLQGSPVMVSVQDLQLNKRHLSILISEEALQELSADISTHAPLLTHAFCCRGWGEISPRHTSPPLSLPFAPSASAAVSPPPSSPVHMCLRSCLPPRFL